MLTAASLTVSWLFGCWPHFCDIVFTEVAIRVQQAPLSYNCFRSATNKFKRLW